MDHTSSMDQAIETLYPALMDVSHAIHENPQTRFREYHAHGVLTQFLQRQAFDVESVSGVETAFVARYGTASPVIAFLAEYDALPEIGHACGHNLIASMALGAAVGLKAVVSERTQSGSVWVIGCPGEEGGGGKIRLIESQVFANVDAALMLHPADSNEVDPPYLARTAYDIAFHGRAAHVIAAPEHGVSALEAVLAFFHLVNGMRSSLRADAHINAIITHGGAAPNVVPEFAALQVVIRAADQDYLRLVETRVLEIAKAAAGGMGCRVEWNQSAPPYWDMRQNATLAKIAEEQFRQVGRPVVHSHQARASTDMGNVSYVVPAFHGNIQLRAGVDPHTREFAAAARAQDGARVVLDGARVLAGIGAHLLDHPSLWPQIRSDFRQGLGAGGGENRENL